MRYVTVNRTNVIQSDSTLLPCPFCNGETGLKEYKPTVSGVAICKKCGARSPICKNDHTGGWKPKAIEAWNTRSVTAAVMGFDASQAERTCTIEKIETDEFGHWVYVSCGHVILTHGKPSYCSTCGAKVLGD